MLPLFATFQPHENIACSPAEFDPSVHKATYRYNYPELFALAAREPKRAQGIFRSLVKNDRFFTAYFVAGWEDGKSSGNKPFMVNQCRLLDDGPQSGTVDVWSREHGKSSAITIAGTVQRVCNDPECTTAIFSFRKSAADKFLDSIRKIFELDFMIWCFPEIFYEKPETQSPSWSLQGGIRVKRQNTVRRENTVEAFGLVEGAPIGGHFDHRIYDDIETDVMARNPDQLDQCYESLLMSRALGREGGTELIIGTYYSHCGVLVKLGEKKDIHGNLMYQLRIFPATDDGTITGKPVFFSQAYLDDKKTDSGFNTQYLCNPTPTHEVKLQFDRFIKIPRKSLPPNRVKIMIVDPAGDKDVQQGVGNDKWSMGCIGINPYTDDLGLSDIYIEDLICNKFSTSGAQDAAVTMYCRNGRILMLGVERVATDSAWLHIKNALAAKGKYVEIHAKGRFGGNLVLLAPAGRSKNYKIESNLAWPLNNGKIHIVDDLPDDVMDELQNETKKFPFFHVDILDMLSYIYDILGDKTFPLYFGEDEEDDEEEQNQPLAACGRNATTGY
jgi:hypothetical protein